MITLTRNDNQEVLHLPADMHWLDEYDWQSLAQSEPVYTLGGNMVIQQSRKHNGRTITLGGEWVWLKREILSTLQAWADTPALILTLDYHGRTFKVIFARPALSEQAPVLYQAPEQNHAPYAQTKINLLTI